MLLQSIQHHMPSKLRSFMVIGNGCQFAERLPLNIGTHHAFKPFPGIQHIRRQMSDFFTQPLGAGSPESAFPRSSAGYGTIRPAGYSTGCAAARPASCNAPNTAFFIISRAASQTAAIAFSLCPAAARPVTVHSAIVCHTDNSNSCSGKFIHTY